MKKVLNKQKLIQALSNCLTLLREIEHNRSVQGLERAVVEYRHNAEVALQLPHTIES